MGSIERSYTKLQILVRWAVFLFLLVKVLGGGVAAAGPLNPQLLLVAVGIYYVIATVLSLVFERPVKNVILVVLDLVAAAAVLWVLREASAIVFFALPILEASRISSAFSLVAAVFSALIFLAVKVMAGPGQALGALGAEAMYALVLLVLIYLAGYLYNMLKRQEHQTKALLSMIQATQELGTSSSLEKVLEVVINMIKALFAPDTVVVYLLDEENPEEAVLRVKAYATPIPDAFTDFNPKVAKSVVGHAVSELKSAKIADYNLYDKEDIIEKNKLLRTVLIAPMAFEGRGLGALYIAHHTPDAYTDESLEMMAMLANQVGLAVRNVQLHQTTLALAITDSLSGAFTHGYFQEHLGQELTKAKYASVPIAMMILDVDFFKKVNDSYGHPQGDALLRQLYGVIKSVVRPSDVICRYGGDEFTVTMLNTNRIGAVMIAEHIREAVEEYEFVLGTQIVHITISGGVAAYPEDAEIKKELVEKADAAMYESKHKGRNKICFAAE